jgi:hypothetical protein
MKRKNSSTHFKGAIWNKLKNKWHAQIMVDRKNLFLGYFDSKKKWPKRTMLPL